MNICFRYVTSTFVEFPPYLYKLLSFLNNINHKKQTKREKIDFLGNINHSSSTTNTRGWMHARNNKTHKCKREQDRNTIWQLFQKPFKVPVFSAQWNCYIK